MTKSSGRMLAALVFVAVVSGARAAPAIASTTDWTWPVNGPVITPYVYDEARPYAAGMHRGIDIAAPLGTKVGAAHAGTVTYAGMLGASGLTVAIATSDGAFVASYLHLSRIATRRGATLEAGDDVGAVGTTGTRSASEPHLHFGVRRAGEPDAYIDPLSLLPPLPTPTRAVPPASVPARDQARAGPAPATIPPPLTVPLGRPLPVTRGAPAHGSQPGRVPGALRSRGRLPVVLEAPLSRHAPLAARSIQGRPSAVHARAAGAWSSPVGRRAEGVSPGWRGAGPERPAVGASLTSAQSARDPETLAWGRLLVLAGLVLLVTATAGRRLLRAVLKVRSVHRRLAGKHRQRAQPGAGSTRSRPARLVGLSQMG
jgi:hypothetical protein